MATATAVATPRLSTRTRRRLGKVAAYAALGPISVVALVPLVWMLSTSLKPDEQLYLWPPQWIPAPVMWENYPRAWNYAPFSTYLRNTLTITLLALVGQMLSASVVAYGFARLRFPGRDFLFMVLLATLMLPGVVTMIPTYLLFRMLGWIDTFYPMIVPAYFGGSAFYVFLLRQFFRSIPMELSDAAKIDGCSNLGTLFRIVMPLAKPALATVAIFSFMNHWNDFIRPLIYLNSQHNLTLTVGLQSFMLDYRLLFQYLMAVSAVMTLPVILIFFVAQRYFIQGMILSGMKG
ncbi:MAG TPA: carbohydrate ABC transporter permease [Chloroflexota bacterium]|jgi:multiple sugar transport system permease protein|nr:carbohydrate ABC transporter permease [Chloroflexota bacterium]